MAHTTSTPLERHPFGISVSTLRQGALTPCERGVDVTVTHAFPRRPNIRKPARTSVLYSILAGEKMSCSPRAAAFAEISALKARYTADRSLFIRGEKMAQILLSLGASEEDFTVLRKVSENLESDPTLPFRKSRNGRFCLDAENHRVYRTEHQPFVLSSDEDFVRHDSAQRRTFDELGEELADNTALRALLVFKYLVINDVSTAPRPDLDYDCSRWVCTVFNLRTVTNSELIGEPALEGVHCDGVDHTMTTFLGGENMTADSAITFIHDMRETNARRWHETDPGYLLDRRQHRDFLDTLLLVDHERKHSLTPVRAVNPAEPATRDMLIFFTRKPALDGHISHPYDSLAAHRTQTASTALPLEITEPPRVVVG
nr:2OG-Fe dioxygenase family protein [Streptomyces antibioticus]